MRLVKVSGMAMVAEHFHGSFGQVIGIVSSGMGLGIMVMAPVTQLFLDTFGLKGTLILLGAFNAHLIVCGALLPYVRPAGYEPILGGNETVQESGIHKIIALFNLSLFGKPQFLYLLIFQAIDTSTYIAWLVYLVSLAESKGISPYLSATIASKSIGGCGSLVGKIITPVFIDRHIVPQSVIYYVGFLTMCLTLIGQALFTSFHGLLWTSFAFSISSGALTVNVFKHCKAALDQDQMTEAFAWLEIAAILSSSLAILLIGNCICFHFEFSSRLLYHFVVKPLYTNQVEL